MIIISNIYIEWKPENNIATTRKFAVSFIPMVRFLIITVLIYVPLVFCGCSFTPTNGYVLPLICCSLLFKSSRVKFILQKIKIPIKIRSETTDITINNLIQKASLNPK